MLKLFFFERILLYRKNIISVSLLENVNLKLSENFELQYLLLKSSCFLLLVTFATSQVDEEVRVTTAFFGLKENFGK